MTTRRYFKGEILLILVLIHIRAKELIVIAPSYPKKIREQIKKNKGNVIFALIFTINLIIKTLIDALLTPYIMHKYGFPISFICTNIIYTLMGVMSVLLYDTLKKDWLMIEALKKYQSERGHLKNKNKLIKFILKKNKKHEFLLNGLLFLKNPGLMVIKKRDGIAQYNGFAGKNTVVLYLTYLLIMNLYWNTVVYFGISFWKPIWEFIKYLIFINYKIYI